MAEEFRPCGARMRPVFNDPGWECTGQGLIVVTTTVHQDDLIPVVLPARALDVIEPDSWWDRPVKRFTGGDHFHLVVPSSPPPPSWRSDALLVFGDNALPVQSLGSFTDVFTETT